jgi:hypothetical protein
MRRREKRWIVVLAAGIVTLLILMRPIFHLISTAYRDRNVVEKLSPGYTDDVSRLDATQIAKIWDMPSDPSRLRVPSTAAEQNTLCSAES